MRKFGEFCSLHANVENVKLVRLGLQSVEQTSQLIVRLPLSLEVQ